MIGDARHHSRLSGGDVEHPEFAGRAAIGQKRGARKGNLLSIGRPSRQHVGVDRTGELDLRIERQFPEITIVGEIGQRAGGRVHQPEIAILVAAPGQFGERDRRAVGRPDGILEIDQDLLRRQIGTSDNHARPHGIGAERVVAQLLRANHHAAIGGHGDEASDPLRREQGRACFRSRLRRYRQCAQTDEKCGCEEEKGCAHH